MADFAIALEYLMANEGAYVHDASDRGGATNWGITEAVLSDWRVKSGLPPATEDDVRRLTQEQAGDLMRSLYWDKIHGDQILSQAVATAVLDAVVNQGPSGAGRLVQRALGFPEADCDGIIGPATVDRLNQSNERVFLSRFIPLIQNRYLSLAINNPSQMKFLGGWLSRSQRMIQLMV